MSLIIPNYLYYLVTGLIIAFAFYFTLGRTYINKVKPIIVKKVSNERELEKLEKSKEGKNDDDRVSKLIEKLTAIEDEAEKELSIAKKFMKKMGLIFLGISIITLIISFIVTPKMSGGLLSKELAFGIGVGMFMVISMLDLKHGQVFLYELSITNTLLLFVLPIILDFIFGCKCIAIGLCVTIVALLLLKVVNFIFNSELSIGGADVDCIICLILSNIGLFIAFNLREDNPVFMQTFYIEQLMTFIAINFSLSMILHFSIKGYKKFKKRENSLSFLKKDDKSCNRNSKNNYLGNNNSNSENSVSSDNSPEANSTNGYSTSKVNVIDLSMEDDNDNSEDDCNDKKSKSKKNKKRCNLDFRCIPSFIMIYALTLFFILFY